GYVRPFAVRTPDGRIIAVGDTTGKLDLYDAATYQPLRALRSSGPGVGRLAFAADGRMLAAGQSDGTMSRWDIATRKELRALRSTALPATGRGVWFTHIEFIPGGGFLLACTREDGVRLWEPATDREVWHQAAGADQGAVALSPDGQTIVTGGFDKILHFRDADTGRERLTVPVETKPSNASIDSIAF